MNTSKVWQVATLCIAAVAAIATPLVYAQQPANAPKTMGLGAPPPELEKLEEGEAPAITIHKNENKSEEAITQQRKEGVVSDIKVHSGGSTYHIIPKQNVGTSLPGDSPGGTTNGAQWVVKEFDWGQKKVKPANPAEQQATDSKAVPPTVPANQN